MRTRQTSRGNLCLVACLLLLVSACATLGRAPRALALSFSLSLRRLLGLALAARDNAQQQRQPAALVELACPLKELFASCISLLRKAAEFSRFALGRMISLSMLESA